MRVHELAKELGVASKELLATLEEMGVAGRSASSSVPEDMVPRLRASGGKATTAPKRREVLEPPTSPKPKKAKKPAPKTAAPAATAPTLSVVPDPAPLMKRVGLLDRVVVTGSTVGASQRSLPIALDVVGGQQLSQRGSTSLSGSLDGVVPGLWLWER